MALVVKNLPASAGDIRESGSIPGSGRSSGGGHGNSLQYSCLENPMDRGAWQATGHGVKKSWTQLKRLTIHAYMCIYFCEVCLVCAVILVSLSCSQSSQFSRPFIYHLPYSSGVQYSRLSAPKVNFFIAFDGVIEIKLSLVWDLP